MQLSLVTMATMAPPPNFFGWLNVALALALAAASAWAFRRLRGTTLSAPAAWAAIAALTIAAVESLLALRPEMEAHLSASLLRYAAAVGTFCPMMAVLGAKRPQDRGWQWVVAALWITLLVPAGQALASSAASRLDLFPAWRLMIVALIAMGLLNYLPTRNALPALLTAAAQACLFAAYLLKTPPGNPQVRVTLGLTALLLAALIAHAQSLSLRGLPRSPRTTSEDALSHLTHRWLVFRNAWGAFWALRIMHRTNQAAEAAPWPVRLQWHGFTTVEGCPDGDGGGLVAGHLEQTLDSLLRRFEGRQSDE